MAVRVSRAWVEVLRSAPATPPRVSRVWVEALLGPVHDANVRVSRAWVEVLRSAPATPPRVSRVWVEALLGPVHDANVRVSRAWVEVLASLTPPIELSYGTSVSAQGLLTTDLPINFATTVRVLSQTGYSALWSFSTTAVMGASSGGSVPSGPSGDPLVMELGTTLGVRGDDATDVPELLVYAGGVSVGSLFTSDQAMTLDTGIVVGQARTVYLDGRRDLLSRSLYRR